ncbi:MAG TPA: NRDE family protein [Candidatus Udaeobacter sp.]|nr:NRDE family protein [Candidatus Udaeobacter sp.]
MCSVVILSRPGHDWPVILAANRDEMASRPWRPPARHWPDRPQVIAGLDELAGGSWLGINDDGVVAGIMNRSASLGPSPGKRSRGELVLEALEHADADIAAGALSELDPQAYRPFNMILADSRDCFWLRHSGLRIEVNRVPEGVSMLTAHDLNDTASRRIGHFLPLFRAVPAPDPERGDWHSWESLLASREHGAGAGPGDAMTIVSEDGFGTLSSALIALPVPGQDRRPIWLFSAGRPDVAPFLPVAIGR